MIVTPGRGRHRYRDPREALREAVRDPIGNPYPFTMSEALWRQRRSQSR